MSLTSGSRLGPYEIHSEIGAGGMGQVYRARDTRLGRDVALKVLPQAFASDPDRRARFEREAQAVATLSHPNIVAIFDQGLHAGQVFVVMELLAGQTLRERIAAGALPARKAIDIGVQIARGLGAAHGKGIVHRDLKPENVFILEDGQVKILDFGLAKAIGSDSGDAAQTVAATDPGTVMGTMGYMAPEQVRGQAVDARADVFAFGAVLYEMLSGRRAFQRETAADTMTAILTQEPPELAGSRPDLSPPLDRIIRHCLEKNANERFQSARDVAFALDALSGTGSSSGLASGAMPAAAAPAARRWAMPITVAAVAVAALAGGVMIGRSLVGDAPEVRFEAKTWDSQWVTNARFAPDGQTIVFSAATSGNRPSLFAIRPGTVTSQPISQPAVHLLSVSSKGELAVLTDARPRGHRLFSGTLARMTLDGAPRAWMEAVSEADWSPDGSTLALIRRDAGKSRLEYPIGELLYEAPSGYLSDLRVSPDGTQVAFFEHPTPGDDRGFVKVVDAGGAVRTLAGEYWGEEGLAWSADGRSIFFSGSVQGAEAYQPLVVNASGTPRVRQAFASAGGMLIQDVAADGRLLVMRDDLRISLRGLIPGETAEREFPWLDFSLAGYLSRDGKHLLFNDESQSAGADYAVALRDVASGQVVRLGAGFTLPLSPDGKWAPALVPSTGRIVLYPTGAGEAVTLDRGPIEHYLTNLAWFPDSRRVIVCGSEPSKPVRCYEQDVKGGSPKPITPEGVNEVLLAHDGRTLLMVSREGSAVMPIGGGPPVAVKGLGPRDQPFGWSNDGRAIVVADREETAVRLFRVDIATGQRTFLRELAPPDRAGLTGVLPSQWIDDGRGYVYAYFRELSKIFTVSGVGR